MNTAAVLSIAFSFLFALVCSWVMLLPFFEERVPDVVAPGDQPARDALEIRKEQALSELEELEMDRLGGKITDADYQQSRAELTADAAAILQQLEQSSDRNSDA